MKNFIRKYINKSTSSNTSLSTIITNKNLIQPRSDSNKKDKINILDHLEKKDDPLRFRIKIRNYDYISEYYSNLTIIDKIKINLNNVLSCLKFNTNKFNKHFFYLEREQNLYYRNDKIAHFGDLLDSKYSVVNNFNFYLCMIFLSYAIGYIWAKLRYDVLFRRLHFTLFPLLMINFHKVDDCFVDLQEALDRYLPRDMTHNELQFILYNKYYNYKNKKKLNKNINKFSEISKNDFDIDRLLKKIN